METKFIKRIESVCCVLSIASLFFTSANLNAQGLQWSNDEGTGKWNYVDLNWYDGTTNVVFDNTASNVNFDGIHTIFLADSTPVEANNIINILNNSKINWVSAGTEDVSAFGGIAIEQSASLDISELSKLTVGAGKTIALADASKFRVSGRESMDFKLNQLSFGAGTTGGTLILGNNDTATPLDYTFDGLSGSARTGAHRISSTNKVNIVLEENTNLVMKNLSNWAILGADGSAIYSDSDVNISGLGSVEFSDNYSLTFGGAIYSKNSNVTISVVGDVNFNKNVVDMDYGAAISAKGNVSVTSTEGEISFSKNKAIASTASGGAIYSYFSGENASSSINLEAFNDISFTDNTAGASGGAIFSSSYATSSNSSSVELISKKGKITFENNMARSAGGAINISTEYVSANFDAEQDIVFTKNKTTNSFGGAISAIANFLIMDFKAGQDINFAENTADINGGAMYIGANMHSSDAVRFEAGRNINFDKNATNGSGGAINSAGCSFLDFKAGQDINFTNNTADLYGGSIAIVATDASVNLKAGQNINFIENHTYTFTYGNGGAIFSSASFLSDVATSSFVNLESETGSILFENNNAYIGGAIFSEAGMGNNIVATSKVALVAGENITFTQEDISSTYTLLNGGSIYSHAKTTNVTATAVSSDVALFAGDSILFENAQKNEYFVGGGSGGAIYSHAEGVGATSTVSLTAGTELGTDGNITFNNNKVFGANNVSGGAIYSFATESSIARIEALSGKIIFTDNTATGDGGAIYAGSVSIKSGGASEIKSNLAGGKGGAIYIDASTATASSSLIEISSGDLIFQGNKQDVDFTNLLNPVGGIANAIYINTVSTSATPVLTLNAVAGSSIKFYDPISGNNAKLTNININNGDSFTGDIIFSGKDYIAESFDEMNRVSDIAANTTLYNGNLILEDSVMFGAANSTATAPFAGTSLTLKSGTSLISRVTDASIDMQNIIMVENIYSEGASFITQENSYLEINGKINLTSGTTTFTINENADMEIDAFSGAGNVLKNGIGGLTLWDATSMTGNVTVDAGTLSLLEEDALATASSVRVNDTARLFAAEDQTFKKLDIFEGGELQLESNTPRHNLTVQEGTIAGALAFVGTLTKIGTDSDILTLSGNYAFSGVKDVVINKGILELRNITYTDSYTQNISVGSGTILDLSIGNTGDINDWGLNITGTGTVIGSNDYLVITNGNAGLHIGSGSSTNNGIFVRIQGDDSIGDVILQNDNKYFGTTYLDSGTLQLSADSQIGDTTYARQLIFNGGNLKITDDLTTNRTMELWKNGEVDVVVGKESTWKTLVDGSLTIVPSFTKNGEGILNFSDEVIFAGDINLNEGTLGFNADAYLSGKVHGGTGTTLAVRADANGATLYVDDIDTKGNIALTSGIDKSAVFEVYIDGVVKVANITGDGVIHNLGDIIASGDIEVDTLNNTLGAINAVGDVKVNSDADNNGLITAGSVTNNGEFNNSGVIITDKVESMDVNSVFNNSGYIGTHLFNGYLHNLSGGIYDMIEHNGDIVNDLGGKIQLSTSNPSKQYFINGVLRNNGLIDFVNKGNTLTVASLTGTTGSINFGYDMETHEIDRLIVTGAANGTQIITFQNENLNGVVKPYTIFKGVITIGDLAGSSIIFDTLGGHDIGVMKFDLVQASTGIWDLKPVGYANVSQAAINSIGAISMGWFSQLDSLSKRMGDLRLSEQKDRGFDAWVRGYGSQTNANLRIAGMSNFREYQYGTDVGGDYVFTSEDEYHSYTVGGFVGYQASRRTFFDGWNSKGETDSMVGGVYATYMNQDGWYADLVLKGQHFNTDFTSNNTGEKGDFENWGMGASIEIGRRFYDEDGWFFEPSVQLSYAHIFDEDFNFTITDVPVSNSDANIYRFQGMTRIGRVFEMGGVLVQPYAKLGIEAQCSSGGKVVLGDAGYQYGFRPNTDGARVVVGGGVAVQATQNSQIFLDYEGSFGDKYERPWALNAGYRVRF